MNEFNRIQSSVHIFFGYSEIMYSTDILQFGDYSKYVVDGFNVVENAKIREEVFPQDCKKAFDIGVRFVKRQKSIK